MLKIPRKILDVSQDKEFLYVDVRIAIPHSDCTPEVCNDIISSKDRLVNGVRHEKVFQEYSVIIDEEDGKDVLKFQATFTEYNRI